MPGHKKPIASITVPLRGNLQTREAVNRLAKMEGKFVADLTFDALCIVYGNRFNDLLAKSAAKCGNQNDQSEGAGST